MRPKKLNIDEAWKVYKLLGDSLKVSQDAMVLDLVMNIVNKVSKENVRSTLEIMYGDDFEIRPPDNIASLLISGISDNNLISFYNMISKVSNGTVS